MLYQSHTDRRFGPMLLIAVTLGLALGQASALAQGVPQDDARPISGHLSPVANAHALSRVAAGAPISLVLSLPLRNQARLDDLLQRLYDPGDSLYGQYLTPQEFTERFGPTPDDYQAVADYARAQGLSVTGTHPNRLLLDVAGPASAVERAFGVRLRQYQAADGHVFRVPDAVPAVPSDVAARLAGVIGLDTSAVRTPHIHRTMKLAGPRIKPIPGPGSGPMGGLAPSDIRTAYGLDSLTLDGSGQTLAVFELDGYTQSDIRTYENTFGLPQIPLENILVDGVSGQPGSGADEATLDIEMVAALAPRVNRVLVYEGPNSDQGILDTYNRIATDDRAQQISTSWGNPENQVSSATLNSEDHIFQQMMAQGQSIYSAAGDNGAYDDTSTLSVDDPSSQPHVTGVGGTTLSTYGVGGIWRAETPWSAPNDTSFSPFGSGGGGGLSKVWPLPAYQQGLAAITNAAAAQKLAPMRGVPDVSLNADPQTGDAIYFGGAWVVFGGTSTATPLWAGFTALVNQQRARSGQGTLGFANSALYAVGKGGNSATDFHDIIQGNNLFYPAGVGYDLASGWGSFQGAHLLADLSNTAAPAPVSAPFSFPAGLNFFSLPDSFPSVPLNSLFGYSGVTLYVWNQAKGTYDTTPTGAASQITAGQGYWARFPKAVTVSAAGQAADATRPYSLPLAAGWNQIGDPFLTQIALANIQITQGSQTYSFVGAQNAGLISGTLFRYDPNAGQYVPVVEGAALTPLLGYWLYTTQAVTLQVPPP